jgi:hypothetical protein
LHHRYATWSVANSYERTLRPGRFVDRVGCHEADVSVEPELTEGEEIAFEAIEMKDTR